QHLRKRADRPPTRLAAHDNDARVRDDSAVVTETTAVENPLREGLRLERTPEPCVLVIFGATGDLTKRKLIPALYQLSHDRLLPANVAIVGFARRDWTDESFRGEMKDAVGEFAKNVHGGVWDSFAETLYFS